MSGHPPNHWLNQINHALRWQYDKLFQLENDISALKKQFEALQSMPRQHVEKIDYNFEQLKVENLNGTLIIGISPNDQGTIEDLSVAGKQTEDVSFGQDPDDPSKSSVQTIKVEVQRYIKEDIATLLAEKANHRNMTLTAEQLQNIMDDMIRQVEDRLAFYMAQLQEGANGHEQHEQVERRLKDDLLQATDKYIDYFHQLGGS
ncbi:spore germination protein GerPC [Paenibacillus macerans]|uniref:spore germination protein GerPC n=1 Tax=Paenibacillus macerans TaxID=44252 RepID=UPI000ED923F8|nr:spore germination protein GerPC [Paenibacillus macerans]MEC0330229.1 spore germination protein GerPC [Paenibacillus macerans]MED4953873.1 spore germination protein GerPC [Paenibacillus macerans]GBK61752.1 germination protein PC [Paenibacillus macerans]GBK68059.1 germination protein PC [Paenibacillus macerans]